MCGRAATQMTNRPRIRSAVDLPGEVREVVEALVAALGDDLTAIYWHGSEARAEAKPDSDHDLIIVMKCLHDDLLLRIQGAFLGRDNWSSFVQTEEELRQYPSTGRLQFHFGLVPVHGRIEAPPFSRENLMDDLRQLALDIRFECRYRLFHRARLRGHGGALSELPAQSKREHAAIRGQARSPGAEGAGTAP